MKIEVNNQTNFNNHFPVNSPLKAGVEKSIQSNHTINVTPTLGKTINANTYKPSVMNKSQNKFPDLNINNNVPIVNTKLPSSKANGIKLPGYIPSNLNQQVNYPIFTTPKQLTPKTNLNSQLCNNTGYVQPALTKKPSHNFSEPAPTNYSILQNNDDQNSGEESNLPSQYNLIKNKVMGNN